jgi:hypothetical protein
VLKIEIIIGLIASALAIIGFMARAYANIRRARRVQRYSAGITTQSEEELRRLREELDAAQEISRERRERNRPEE